MVRLKSEEEEEEDDDDDDDEEEEEEEDGEDEETDPGLEPCSAKNAGCSGVRGGVNMEDDDAWFCSSGHVIKGLGVV
ncbi:hypothetical protein BGZ99_006177 [Dissophora globulifera]|uniref:Uncharacterized protein n=1 Tax=Dissophora globulifera TaxID=979702 RepID=A0A9P6USD3_9FUNG|nr:hypothetical protein BGZ99_006177 [Dissophora globulifera]